MYDAMGRKHEESEIGHVDQRHHDEFVGSLRIGGRTSDRSALIAVVECGFIAVVAIGDDQLLVPHLVLDRGDYSGIGDLPDAVGDSVFVGDVNGWFGSGFGSEKKVDFTGILVQQKQLFIVSAGGTKQVETISLRLGQSLLVAIDDLGGIVLDAA